MAERSIDVIVGQTWYWSNLVQWPKWSSMHTPPHTPNSMRPILFCSLDLSRHEMGMPPPLNWVTYTTHVTPFSKWPPAKQWNHIFLHITAHKAHRETILMSAYVFNVKQSNGDIYIYLGLLITLPCDVIFKMAALEITFSCITQLLLLRCWPSK